MDIQALLKEAGPYTAPLCGAMVWIMQWGLSDRARLLKALSDSTRRERELAEKRTSESIESARLMSESNQALHDHDRVLERLIDRMNRRG